MTDIITLCLPAVCAHVSLHPAASETYDRPTERWVWQTARLAASRYDGYQNTEAAAVIKRLVANWMRRHPPSSGLLDDPCDDGKWL